MEKIKNKIRELRISKNLTQQQLADELHVTKQAISKWEKGKSVPDISSIELLAEFFGVSVDYLVNDHSEAAKAKDASPERIIKLNAILICILAFMTAIVIILSSVILGVLLRKDKQDKDTSVPNVVSVNGLEFTYIPEYSSTEILDEDTTFVIRFHIYNSTDYEREIRDTYFTVDNDVLYVMSYNVPFPLAAHKENTFTIAVGIRERDSHHTPMYENLGEVPVHSATVKFGGQPLVTMKW